MKLMRVVSLSRFIKLPEHINFLLKCTRFVGTSYDEIYDNNDLNALLRRELAGFKRRERLDVKKPGPLFSTNNYAFKTQSPLSK